MVDLRALLNLGVLHDDGVLDDGALGDLHAAEEDRVDDRALDDAAVGHQGVGALALAQVAGGQVVAHLGVDRALRREELAANLGIQQGHVEVEVGLDGIDLAGQPLVLIAHDPQAAVVDVALEQVAAEVVHAVGGALLDQLAQQLALGDVDLEGRAVARRRGGADLHAGDRAVLGNGQVGVVAALGAGGGAAGAGVHHSDVRTGLHVLAQRVGVVDVVDRVAVGQHDVLLAGQAQEREV